MEIPHLLFLKEAKEEAEGPRLEVPEAAAVKPIRAC